MLEREVVTHLNELTPRNVDSSRGQAGLKKLQCFSLRSRKNKTVFTTHSQILSTVYNTFHWRGEQVNLYYISTRVALSLFSPPQREPTDFQWLEWDTLLRSSVSTSNFPLSTVIYLPASESAIVKAKNHLFANVKKWFRIQMLFNPSCKNPGRLRWRVDRRLWNRSTLACLLFYFSWQLNLWCISPVQINCLLARAPWDWKLFTPHKNENN